MTHLKPVATLSKVLFFGIFFLSQQHATAQFFSKEKNYTRKDSLRGALRPERNDYDVLRYDLNIKVDPIEKFISGYNDITFKVLENTTKIQLDLFENMKVDSILYHGKTVAYKRDYDAVFLYFDRPLQKNTKEKLRFYYSGKPIAAKNAPWDGGFVWKKDEKGKDWIAVAVQGTGASLWYPVKDHQTDEPDEGATIKVAVPNGLMNVSNGRFTGKEDLKNGYTRWDWEVKSPINNYDITVNIGDYVHFGEHYKDLDLDFYVLSYNLEKAKEHFQEVKPMMDCFQAKFGVYPFAEDSYKLVETPYLGMEHQSAVAYGNKYKNGYAGTDISDSGVGMLFDYITIHESGHEWFGNSITSKDIADMWIHEAFTTYSETVFVECNFGYEKAMAYINGQANRVMNDRPIIGDYNVNHEGSIDMYFKGALMLNTLRNVINDDAKWWKLLLDYSNTYRHKIIDTETVIQFFNTHSKRNLTPIFDQYLRYSKIPELEIKTTKEGFEYRWLTDVPNFSMPVEVYIGKKIVRLEPTNAVQTYTTKKGNPVILAKEKFYVKFTKK